MITLLETFSFSDIDAVQKGLARSPLMGKVTLNREGLGLAELVGVYYGTEENLEGDLQSLVVDRFSVDTKRQWSGRLVFTLRKLSAKPQPLPSQAPLP